MNPQIPSPHARPRGAERRRYPRAALDLPLTISLEDGRHEGRLRDVSTAGVCFFLDREVAEMTVLSIRFELPGPDGAPQEPVVGSGVVVRCQPLSPAVAHWEIAVFMNEVSEDDRRRIARFVESRLAS